MGFLHRSITHVIGVLEKIKNGDGSSDEAKEVLPLIDQHIENEKIIHEDFLRLKDLIAECEEEYVKLKEAVLGLSVSVTDDLTNSAENGVKRIKELHKEIIDQTAKVFSEEKRND